jgi:hypothetical protein
MMDKMEHRESVGNGFWSAMRAEREHKNRGRIKGNRRRKDWDPSSWFIEQRARKEGRGGMLLGREVLKKGGIGMTSPTRDAEEGR